MPNPTVAITVTVVVIVLLRTCCFLCTYGPKLLAISILVMHTPVKIAAIGPLPLRRVATNWMSVEVPGIPASCLASVQRLGCPLNPKPLFHMYI